MRPATARVDCAQQATKRRVSWRPRRPYRHSVGGERRVTSRPVHVANMSHCDIYATLALFFIAGGSMNGIRRTSFGRRNPPRKRFSATSKTPSNFSDNFPQCTLCDKWYAPRSEQNQGLHVSRPYHFTRCTSVVTRSSGRTALYTSRAYTRARAHRRMDARETKSGASHPNTPKKFPSRQNKTKPRLRPTCVICSTTHVVSAGYELGSFARCQNRKYSAAKKYMIMTSATRFATSKKCSRTGHTTLFRWSKLPRGADRVFDISRPTAYTPGRHGRQ